MPIYFPACHANFIVGGLRKAAPSHHSATTPGLPTRERRYRTPPSREVEDSTLSRPSGEVRPAPAESLNLNPPSSPLSRAPDPRILKKGRSSREVGGMAWRNERRNLPRIERGQLLAGGLLSGPRLPQTLCMGAFHHTLVCTPGASPSGAAHEPTAPAGCVRKKGTQLPLCAMRCSCSWRHAPCGRVCGPLMPPFWCSGA